MTFNAAKLKTGELRNAYIARRYHEGAKPTAIRDEINAPELFGGEEGKAWSLQLVNEILKKEKKKAVNQAVKIEAGKVEVVSDGDGGSTVAEAEAPLLSPERLAELTEKARTKVRADMVKSAEEEFLARETKRLANEMKVDPGSGEDLVTVHMDLPEFMPFIHLDMPHGQKFYHGHTYSVRRRVAAVLLEQMARGHDHQAEIDGKSKWKNRQRSTVLSGIHGVVNGRSQFMV